MSPFKEWEEKREHHSYIISKNELDNDIMHQLLDQLELKDIELTHNVIDTEYLRKLALKKISKKNSIQQ